MMRKNTETFRNTSIIINTLPLILFLLLQSPANSQVRNNEGLQIPNAEQKYMKQSDSTGENKDRKTVADPFIITENITDYCYLFEVGADFNSFKNLSEEQAHKKKSFTLHDLNYKNAFLSFQTKNTWPPIDGDSETEWYYELCYWNLQNNTRFIALNTRVITWVSEETESFSFYIHNRDGVTSVKWEAFRWNLGDFIGQKYKYLFDAAIWANPPVDIYLPNEGNEIVVNLAFHEYMDNNKAFLVYDSLKVKEHELKFNPLLYF